MHSKNITGKPWITKIDVELYVKNEINGLNKCSDGLNKKNAS